MNRSMIGVALCAGTFLAAAADAQGTLAQRVAAVRDGELQFEFEGREDVCGDGRSYIRVGETSIHGNWNNGSNGACIPGPVRVVLRKNGGAIVSLREYVGPVTTADGRVELGTVTPAEASAYLLDLAEHDAQGTVGHRAIFPAVIGRDVVAWPALLRIARARSGDRKNDAAFWLSRYAAAKLQGSDDPFDADRHAETDEEDVKKHAVFALSQFGGDEGFDELIVVARTNRDAAVRGQALFWLGQSGNPRALDLFEDILRGKVPPPRGEAARVGAATGRPARSSRARWCPT